MLLSHRGHFIEENYQYTEQLQKLKVLPDFLTHWRFFLLQTLNAVHLFICLSNSPKLSIPPSTTLRWMQPTSYNIGMGLSDPGKNHCSFDKCIHHIASIYGFVMHALIDSHS